MRCRAFVTGFRPKCAYLSPGEHHALPPSMPHCPRQGGLGFVMARPQSAAEFDRKDRRRKPARAVRLCHRAGVRGGHRAPGTEVKSLRFGEGTIAESYAEVKGNEVWLINSNIPEFSHGNRHNHEPKRPRKLLLNGREINKVHAGSRGRA